MNEYQTTTYLKSLPYLYRGVVKSIEDPLNIGRCKIHVPSVHGDNQDYSIIPWSRPISNLPINEVSGNYYTPSPGDIVWVLFEGGNKDYPVYIGGTYGTGDIKIDKEKYMIYQHREDFIYYDKSGKFVVKLGDNEFSVDNSGAIHVESIQAIFMKSPDISLEGAVNITGSGTLNGEVIATYKIIEVIEDA